MKSKEKVRVKAEVGTWCQLPFSWGGREKEKGFALKRENAQRPGALHSLVLWGTSADGTVFLHQWHIPH